MSRKKTHEEFLDEIKTLVGDEYKIVGKYVNTATKIEMVHNKCGHKYEVVPNSFLRGRRCPLCSGKMKKTTDIFKKEVFELIGNEYEVLGEYKNSNTKILFKHTECNHKYEATPSKFLNGRRCPKCFGNHKKTTEQYKKEVYDLVGDEAMEFLRGKFKNGADPTFRSHYKNKFTGTPIFYSVCSVNVE